MPSRGWSPLPPASTPSAVRAQLDADETTAAYERDRAEARQAAGSAAELQGKTAATDGPVRFTASSVTFERAGVRLVAGGYQPVAAYDVLLANLDPSLRRRAVPDDPADRPGGVSGRPRHAGDR